MPTVTSISSAAETLPELRVAMVQPLGVAAFVEGILLQGPAPCSPSGCGLRLRRSAATLLQRACAAASQQFLEPLLIDLKRAITGIFLEIVGHAAAGRANSI